MIYEMTELEHDLLKLYREHGYRWLYMINGEVHLYSPWGEDTPLKDLSKNIYHLNEGGHIDINDILDSYRIKGD